MSGQTKRPDRTFPPIRGKDDLNKEHINPLNNRMEKNQMKEKRLLWLVNI